MEIIEQYSIHYDFPPKKTRPAARGLVIRDGKILLTYEKNKDVYMSPGGGLEAGETFPECCIREISEESGYIAEVKVPFVTINEYCFDTCYEAHYFICEVKGQGQQQLTPTEIDHGVCPVWLSIEKAIEIFSHYEEKTEDHRSLYLREYTILNKYLEYQRRKELVKFYLGKTVNIVMDRPLGYIHKKENYSLTYPINYGYLPGIIGGDGEELDVYLLGVNEPVEEYTARIIGIVHRHNDNEDKLVAAPNGMNFSKEEIEKEVSFQEQYYDTEIEIIN